MPDAVWFINILVLIVLGIVSWVMKNFSGRIDRTEAKHETLKDAIQRELKDVYRHHDDKHSEIRTELHRFSESIRTEIQMQYKNQTDLIVKILTNKNGGKP